MGALKVNNSKAAWLDASLIVLQQTSHIFIFFRLHSKIRENLLRQIFVINLN